MDNSALIRPNAPREDTSPWDRPAQMARLAAVTESLPEAVICIDRSWHMTYANAEAVRVSRLEPDKFSDKTFWEFFPFLPGTDAELRYRRAMQTGEPDQFEYFSERLAIWVDMRTLPTDEGIALVYRDVTGRKDFERREAQNSRQMRQLFEAMPDAVVVIDHTWRFIFANQKAMELTGRPDLLGHNIFEIFPGNKEEPFYSTYQATMEHRTHREFEAWHTAPLNLWLRVLSKPYDDGIIVFFSDITARKNAELREQLTARRLAQALEVTSDAVATLDRSWRYTYLNANAERLIDPAKRLIGKVIWDEFPLAVGGPAWDLYHRSMNEGLPGETEIFYPAPVDRWLAMTSQPTPEGIVIFFRDITAQKMHDDTVRAQLDLLTTVQAASRLATWECDVETGALTYGPGAFPNCGHPLTELTNFTDLERIMQPGHAKKIRGQVRHALETGQPLIAEFAVTSPQGETVWIEARAQIAGNGEHFRVRGMSIDVTDRHLSQAGLIESEARYRVLADLNPNAIWMGDSTGRLTYANVKLLSYIGRTLEECLTDGWLPSLAAEEHERVTAAWRHAITSGETFELEALIRKADTGELRFWHLRAAPVRDHSGAILHWLGVGQDIHDAKTYTASLQAQQAETERRHAELESIYATAPVGMALLDPVHFTFLNLNDHEARMLGASREDILGRPLTELAPPDKVPGLLEMMRSVAAGNPIRNHLLEGELTPKPGEQRAWTVNYAPVYNADGTVRAISTASIEITHQKRAEAALIQSEKLAAVGRLATSISHEINNPLEAITNLLYLIALDDDLPESLRVYVGMAQSELSRVSQIATQTLRFHRQAVAPTLVSAADLVDAVIRLYTGRLSNSGIQVDKRYTTSHRILCFENDIRQVLNNLIANAIDAMRRGGRITIRAHATSYPRPGLRITIADNGHGMDQETVRRIFEPFFTTKDLNGTGLGLWISSGIVDRHEGKLLVRSTTDERHHGTIFTLYLPNDRSAGFGALPNLLQQESSLERP